MRVRPEVDQLLDLLEVVKQDTKGLGELTVLVRGHLPHDAADALADVDGRIHASLGQLSGEDDVAIGRRARR